MSQLTDAQLIAEATVIKTETALGANTADRVGTMFIDSIENKINIDVIDPNTALGTSDALIPTQNAVKTYADSLVVGLLDDRGNFTPNPVFPGVYPTLNGSGTGGTIQKGDLWFVDTAGFINGLPVAIGSSVRALDDNPAQISSKWNVINTGLGLTPENVLNKSTNVTLGGATPSDILYPSQKATKSYVDTNALIKSADNALSGINTFNGSSNFPGGITTNGIDINYELNIGGTTPMNLVGDPGTSGQVLTSQGGAATPTWETPTPGISLADDNTFTGSNTFTQSTQFTAGIVSPAGGTAQFDGTLDVNGFFRVDGQSGTAGQVLTSQGTNTPIWANPSNASKPEFRARIAQTGTFNPSNQATYIDTITIGTAYVSPTWRYIELSRVSTGTFMIKLVYDLDQIIDTNKVEISFSDNKLTNGGNVNASDGYSRSIEFTFYRYDSSGTLVDGIVWSNVYLKIW